MWAADALLVLVLIGSAAAVYAIYRYGVIPAIRTVSRDRVFTGLWSTGGWSYRCTLFGIVLGLLVVASAGFLMPAGFIWQAGVAFIVGMAILFTANYYRFRFVRQHQPK